MAKRKPQAAPQTSQAQSLPRRSPWSDWTPNTIPFICTIGADLVESQRLADQLHQLRAIYEQSTIKDPD